MFHCSFMFTTIARDEEFQRLDDAIADYARTLEGFLGSESWFSADKSKINAVYFFETMEAVRTFATFPTHLEAKKKYATWYSGYQVVISEVQATYGDGHYDHITQKKN